MNADTKPAAEKTAPKPTTKPAPRPTYDYGSDPLTSYPGCCPIQTTPSYPGSPYPW